MPSQTSGSTAPGPERPLATYASVAHVARVYDYLLGGKDNFAVDREAAEQAIRINPDVVSTARANRAFGIRTTGYLVSQAGIRQFLDIGTGMPTNNNIHEVAQSIAPESRIVYVDHDPIVLTHARALLTSAPEGATDYLEADLREPGKILAEAAQTLDFSRPVAIMLIAILHLILDRDDPYDLVSQLVNAVVPGSYVVVSHAASDIDTGAMISMANRLNELMAQQSVPRTHREVASFFAGLDLLEPGLVRVPEWRPASVSESAARAQMWGAVGRKP
ncbi:MAG TPA: SAM-dependent methyltransferase [Streptosporangiaceae bacterium]|nr:SAM-dependent methyltransferase [Streptosporangiaceae bacterium]